MRRGHTIQTTRAFTLVELMIVVAVIGLLAVIAVPSFFRARLESQRKTCMRNLTVIAGAKEQYAFDHANNRPGGINQLVPQYLRKAPTCPAGGTYTLRALTADPRCSLSGSGHTI